MNISITQLALVCMISYAFFRFFRRFLLPAPFANIPGPPSSHWWKGNMHQIYDVNGWEFHKQLYEHYGRIVKINGLFGNKVLYVSDPLALHHIVVKDQYIYEETDQVVENNRLMFGNGLLSSMGERHRIQRKMLNPVFNVNHMREMVPLFFKISYQLRDVLAPKTSGGTTEIDMLDWMTRTALELVGQAGLGYSFNVMREGAADNYGEAVKNLLIEIFIGLLPHLVKIGYPKFRRFVVDLIPHKKIQCLKNVIDIMENTSRKIYQSKVQALQHGDEAVSKQIGEGKDIMSLLLKANMAASEEDRLPESELLGQMTTLIFAAMDTTSSALSRILHLLALNPEVQEKVRHEVREAKKDGDLTYDQLEKLPYLDGICRETLRLYSPVTFVTRTARQDIVLPLSVPIKGLDGHSVKEIHVPADTNVIVAILAANRSKEVWGDDAEEWKPERWLGGSVDKVAAAKLPGVYSNMMTFLGGGRACIGFKFSQLEMKVVLTVLLESFEFSPSEKKIYWKLGGIVTPSVEGSKSVEPEMPLNVTRIVA